MTFQESIISAFNKYGVIEGRASRAEYWWFFLFNFLVFCATIIISGGNENILGLIYLLITLIPNITLGVRRLHDTGKTGFWVLISIIPFAFIILMVLYAIEGDEDENIYGENPLAS